VVRTCAQKLNPKKEGMKMKLKKYRLIFIWSILIMVMSLAGWSISIHYDQIIINDGIQKELKNDSQTGSTISKFNKNSPILFLISTGLIGIVGVRRVETKSNLYNRKIK
jgi:hypothetical protein